MSDVIQALDAHIHYSLKYPVDELLKTMEATDTDMANLAVVPSRRALSSVPDALMVKAMNPGRFYVFASLDVSVFFRYKGRVGEKMRDYAKDMLRCGCDGIKIIEGKPNMRKLLPVPDWDEPQWEPFFQWCEEEAIPILWHVNDPETFWDREKAPSFAVERGWIYDESFVNNEAQYAQVLAVLQRHPRLKIIFAHFFFLSAQLERLSGILDSYPELRVDLTPGIEMYENFSRRPEETRAFFAKYAKRIVYGTDIGARGVLAEGAVSYEESLSRAALVRSFLEKDGSETITGDGIFLSPDTAFEMPCLGLEPDALRAILRGNFLDFVGKAPVPVDGKLVLKDCRRVRTTLFIMGFIDKELVKDTSCLRQVEQYFKKRRRDRT